MKSSKELFEELKNNISISNLEHEYSLEDEKKWRSYDMKKNIIAISSACLVLISSVALAFNGEKIIEHWKKDDSRGLDKGIETAVQNGYIEETNMETIEQQVSLENSNIVENMYMGVKINDFVMDDYNLSVKFSFDFDENIDNVVDLSNLHNIKLPDLYILDENNVVIYNMFYNEADFNQMCQKHNLDLKWGEFSEKCLNNGLNTFIEGASKELRSAELQYNMYTDKYPKSKKLDFYFSKIEFQEENKEERTVLTGDWYIHLDVPEKFYNRTEEYYEVVSSTNSKFNVYTAKVTDTGFEFGMTIDGEKKPEYPQEVINERKRIVDEYGVVDEETGIYSEESQRLMSEKLNEMYSTSPYKELQEQYDKEAHPIMSSGFMSVFYHQEYNIEEDCYIMNSNGEKFKCSLSPSRKSNHSFIDNDKYDYYETYTLTKYDATDEITVILNYRGTREEIKLQKLK